MDEDDELDDLGELSDEELERELTVAAANEHRDELYRALLAERARRGLDALDD